MGEKGDGRMLRFFINIYAEPCNLDIKLAEKLSNKVGNRIPYKFDNTQNWTVEQWRDYAKKNNAEGIYTVIDCGCDSVKYRDVTVETYGPQNRRNARYAIYDIESGVQGAYGGYDTALAVAKQYSAQSGRMSTIRAEMPDGTSIVVTQLTPSLRKDKGEYKIEINHYIAFGGYEQA